MRSPTLLLFPTLLFSTLACGDSQGASDSLLSDSLAFTQTSEQPPPPEQPTTSTDGATDTATDESEGSGTGDQCGGCPFTRPNILFVLDYSSSMNQKWTDDTSYYDFLRDALIVFLTQEVSLAQRMNFALMHFGHDPKPNSPGTMIEVDQSGLVDGSKLDFPWTVGGLYVPCQNDDLASDLALLIPPAFGQITGIATWTKGAMDFALGLIEQQRADLSEPIDGDPFYRIVLLTDGKWTNATGEQTQSPASESPVPTTQLLADAYVKTYVIAVGDALGTAAADEIAAAGGTITAYDAEQPDVLAAQLKAVFTAIDQEPGITPDNCPG